MKRRKKKDKTKDKLHACVDKMDEFQAELVLSFIKTLFGL